MLLLVLIKKLVGKPYEKGRFDTEKTNPLSKYWCVRKKKTNWRRNSYVRKEVRFSSVSGFYGVVERMYEYREKKRR
jgi:hypothetical protein